MVWAVTGKGRVVVASLKEKKTHSKHFTPKLKSHTSIQEFFLILLITSDLNKEGWGKYRSQNDSVLIFKCFLVSTAETMVC